MKKVLALALALVIALSMSAMAFAQGGTATPTTNPAPFKCGYCGSTYADQATLLAHQQNCAAITTTVAGPSAALICPHCQQVFYNEAEFNKHIVICFRKECSNCHEIFGSEAEYNAHLEVCDATTKDYINLDVKTILDMIIDLVKSSMTQWGDIESIIVRIVDFVENIGTAAVSEAEVAGAVADLEASLADVEIPGLSDLLNQLKAKIKAMYAGSYEETTVEVTTEVAPPAETGSSAAGIAAFAAISVAAAAAYVCTKKSK